MTDVADCEGLWSVWPPERSGHHCRVKSAQRAKRASIAVAASCVALAGALISACGGDDATLRGMTREDPLDVSSVTVADVTDQGEYGEHSGQFTMMARPGGLLVVYFGYTNCPDLCPTTLALVRAARRELGSDADRIDLAMVTVDPDRDTPDVMNDYLSSFTDRFHALHPASLEELKAAEAAFLASSTIVVDASGEVEVGHSATAYVVDETGTVLVEWPFGVDKETMLNDFRILLNRV